MAVIGFVFWFTMVAILVGGDLGGLLGMLIAVPFFASIKNLLTGWYHRHNFEEERLAFEQQEEMQEPEEVVEQQVKHASNETNQTATKRAARKTIRKNKSSK